MLIQCQLDYFLRDKGQVSNLQAADATTFWQKSENVTKYPSLANLIKRILCVPATSASVERVFSRGGIVVRPHRSSLAPQKLHKILFLKCNEQIFHASELLENS